MWPPTEPIFDARVRWLSECDGEGGGEDDSGDEGGGGGGGVGEGEGGCSVVALEGAAALGPLVTEWQAVCMRMHMQYAVLLCACSVAASPRCMHATLALTRTLTLTKLHIIQALVVSGERERSPGQLTRILNDLGAHLATLT